MGEAKGAPNGLPPSVPKEVPKGECQSVSGEVPGAEAEAGRLRARKLRCPIVLLVLLLASVYS